MSLSRPFAKISTADCKARGRRGYVTACSSAGWNSKQAAAVPLPGAVWLFRPAADDLYKVYGDNFMIRKQLVPLESTAVVKVEGYGVPAVQARTVGGGIVTVAPVAVSPQTSHPVALCRALPESTAAVQPAAGIQLAIIPQEQMLETVLDAARGRDNSGPANMIFETHSSSPRRTRKVKFTCDRCGATNIKPVNPFAWKEGTVFAKCGGCNVTHKLIDNLKLFHELSGPVFPAARKLNVEIPSDLPNPFDPQSWQI